MAEENKTQQVVKPVEKAVTPTITVPKGTEKQVVKPIEELSGISVKTTPSENNVTPVQAPSKQPTEVPKYTTNVFHHSKSFGDPLMLDIIRVMPMTEHFIMALHLGLINGKNYSINGIASFLEMGNETVRKIITEGLESYKNAINDSIETEIKTIYKVKSL